MSAVIEDIDGWIYYNGMRYYKEGAYLKSKTNPQYYVMDRGYEIPQVFFMYSQSLLEREIPKYRRWIAIGNRDRLIPELEWMEYRVKHFKTLKLLKGEDQ